MASGETELPREVERVRRTDAGRLRRWFTSADRDFVVWQDGGGRVVGYRFCYDKGRRERALHWRAETGFVQRRVDAGASRGGGHEATPVLTFAEPPDLCRALLLFRPAGVAVTREFARGFEEKLLPAMARGRRRGTRVAVGRRRRSRRDRAAARKPHGAPCRRGRSRHGEALVRPSPSGRSPGSRAPRAAASAYTSNGRRPGGVATWPQAP